MDIIVNEKKCTGCEKCLKACPKGPKIWKIKNKIAHPSNLEYCHICTICGGVCPTQAITILRDTDYRKHIEN